MESPPAGSPIGPTTRQRGPDNREFPFSSLDTDRFRTPADAFFIRSHFAVPEIATNQWRLTVEGEVDHPFELDLDGLRRLPARTTTATLECSGNGRGFLDPPQLGVRWEMGAVGNAGWTGAPLADVLERAGVRPGAIEVILEGADRGTFGPPQHETPGSISYARSLPLSKARSDGVLLAYEINGEPLPPDHGHPVRAVVPGWYGMASVKWLRRIIVTDRPFHGFFQTMEYAVWERRHGLPSLVPVAEVQVKAQIARPGPFEVVPRDAKYRMFGAAWAGESQVAKVEVSDDGGRTWSPARLLGDATRFTWRFWEHDWYTPDRPGRATVMARATDDQGRIQPIERDPGRRDAVISHVLPIAIELR